MDSQFVSKYKNNEYISKYLYDYIKENESSLIPSGFDLDAYNTKILDRLYLENKDYFANMYKGIDDNIHLDEEQCKAILADEKYSLIIAGAGTGKTTTMVSKVKYLVDKKHADPERILVMSYTRKATEEIARKIEESFELPVHITTFHSLGYEYIKEIFNDCKCVIMDRNKKNEIFLDYFRNIFKDKRHIEEIINNFDIVKEKSGFIFGNFFLNNYKRFDSYDDLVDGYVKYKLEEAKNKDIKTLIEEKVNKQLLKDTDIRSLKGEYVKSAGEMVIANFLYTHGLDYYYEEVYEELLENRAIYKPDFTIDYAGEKIYIEYFGLDDQEYNKIRKYKRDFHKKRGNKFIEIDRLPLENIVDVLDKKLKDLGIVYHELSDEEVYEHLLRLNPTSQVYPFLYFLYDCLITRKESFYRSDYDRAKEYVDNCDDEKIAIQYKYLINFTNFYSEAAFGGDYYYFDFADLLYFSVKYLEKLTIDTKLRFDYIIIDEYQDISQIKYELTYKTAKKNDAKVYAVGDDWQSIYAFSGSRIEYIYNFEKFFQGSKSFNISRTYRNSQELIDYSGTFIMRNPDQLRKKLISSKHLDNPIIYKKFDSSSNNLAEIDCLKKTILEIHDNYPDHNILVLGRTNRMINRILEDEELLDDIGSKITFKGNEDIQIDSMTMHKSKGLTYDEVIIIGLNKTFPSVHTNIYWYEELYKNKPIEEHIPFAEERRLFYVALTRTKNRVYLLIDENAKNRSEFIREIDDIINEAKEDY